MHGFLTSSFNCLFWKSKGLLNMKDPGELPSHPLVSYLENNIMWRKTHNILAWRHQNLIETAEIFPEVCFISSSSIFFSFDTGLPKGLTNRISPPSLTWPNRDGTYVNGCYHHLPCSPSLNLGWEDLLLPHINLFLPLPTSRGYQRELRVALECGIPCIYLSVSRGCQIWEHITITLEVFKNLHPIIHSRISESVLQGWGPYVNISLKQTTTVLTLPSWKQTLVWSKNLGFCWDVF